jgi:23S rRNA (cytidine1920-2'-O)/16S rRNA (cytidine1409-2'-O)-methyltransferase
VTVTEKSGVSRLDVALAARGLAASRTSAARAIAQGLVTVDGRPALKPATLVSDDSDVVVASVDHYVSRAAHKLVAALDAFAVPVAGRTVLDVGASTGGFTQVLLERGAHCVIALDVGHDQLAPIIRNDDRVVVVEGVNARYLTKESLLAFTPGGTVPSLVVADLSFIPLGLVLPAIVGAVGPLADIVVLIKPQFEVGRGGVKEGIVRNAGLREDAVAGVLWTAWDLGFGTAGVISSPIAGTAGNREYLAWFSTVTGSNPTEWSQQVSALTHP